MSDCTNIDIRELLPDFLHGKLGPDVRARVEGHLAGCTECRAELEIIDSARAILNARTGPAIDVGSIVAFLPRHSASAPRQRRSLVPVAWRLAAALALVAGGAAAVVFAVRSRTSPTMVTLSDSVTVTPAPGALDSAVARPDSSPAAPTARPTSELATTTPGGVINVAAVSELGDEELEALIELLDRLEAAPHADPDLLPARRVVGETAGTTR
ncbi:MAG: zf-HC2 domain-containing protein [Gemmatimonadota bacterium]